MYLPKHFQELRLAEMHDLIVAHPLATLVTLTSDGLDANHIPLHLLSEPAPNGALQGHVARANPLWREHRSEIEVMAVFQGPQSYITPEWYPTKEEDGRVVPTWNYAVVHAYGPLRTFDDPAWLRAHLERLTSQHESSLPEPWRITDAPEKFIEQLIASVVGIEMPITRLVGKWKVSQNQPERNQRGVIEGLRELDNPEAHQMAGLVEARGKRRGE